MMDLIEDCVAVTGNHSSGTFDPINYSTLGASIKVEPDSEMEECDEDESFFDYSSNHSFQFSLIVDRLHGNLEEASSAVNLPQFTANILGSDYPSQVYNDSTNTYHPAQTLKDKTSTTESPEIGEIHESTGFTNYPFVIHEDSNLANRTLLSRGNAVNENHVLPSEGGAVNYQHLFQPDEYAVSLDSVTQSYGKLGATNNPYEVCFDSDSKKYFSPIPEDVVNANYLLQCHEDGGRSVPVISTDNQLRFDENVTKYYQHLVEEDVSKNCPPPNYDHVINSNNPFLHQEGSVLSNEMPQMETSGDQNCSFLVNEEANCVSSQILNSPQSAMSLSDIWSNSFNVGSSPPLDSTVEDEPEIKEFDFVTNDLVIRFTESCDNRIIDNKTSLKEMVSNQTRWTNEESLDYSHCPTRFKHQDSLRVRLKRLDENEHNLCLQCQIKFSTRKEMLDHLRTHEKLAEPRIADCCNSQCSTKFRSKPNFKDHGKFLCDKDRASDHISNGMFQSGSRSVSNQGASSTSNSLLRELFRCEFNGPSKFSSSFGITNNSCKSMSKEISNFTSNNTSIGSSNNAPMKVIRNARETVSTGVSNDVTNISCKNISERIHDSASYNSSISLYDDAPVQTVDNVKQASLNCAPDSVSDSFRGCAYNDTRVNGTKTNNVNSQENIDEVISEREHFLYSQSSLSFCRAINLEENLKELSGEKLHTRTSCHLNFQNEPTLKYHVDCAYQNDKLCVDASCSAKPSKSNPLSQEVAESSSEIKQFLCEYCPNLFEKKCALIAHMKTHVQTHIKTPSRKPKIRKSGRGKLTCVICRHRFSYASKLRAHMKTHSNGGTGSKNMLSSTKNRKSPSSKTTTRDDTNTFKCPECSATLTSRLRLKHHLSYHFKESRFSCEHCPAQFSDKSLLRKHLMIHLRVGVSKYSCPYCSAKFDFLSGLKSHLTVHLKPQFVCKKCPAKFHFRKFLLLHSKIHVKNKPSAFSKASKEFVKGSKVSAFCKKSNQTFVNSKKSCGLLTQKVYSCSKCSTAFSSMNALNGHMNIHKNRRGIACNLRLLKCNSPKNHKKHSTKHLKSTSNSPTLKSLVSIKKECGEKGSKPSIGLKRMSCADCPAVFAKMRDFQRHLKCHSYNMSASHGKLFSCPLCSAKFERKYLFIRHLLVHSDANILPKTQSLTAFRNESSSQACSSALGNVESVSTKNSPPSHLSDAEKNSVVGRIFSCSYCDAQFKCNGSLQKHTLVHFGQKPFSCKLCPMKFLKQSHFKEHMKRHIFKRMNPKKISIKSALKSEKGSGKSLFQDSESSNVSKKYSKVNIVQQHFACKFCTAEFLQVTSLKKHLLKHKHFGCDQCPAKFFSRSVLNRHLEVHADNDGKRYSCGSCTAKFFRKQNLLYHMEMQCDPNSLKKLHACPHCTSKFVHQKYLVQHLKSHSNLKSLCSSNQLSAKQNKKSKKHCCEECPAKFVKKQDLYSHKLVHSDDGKRLFACSHCSAKYLRRHMLKRHLVVHTEATPSCSRNQQKSYQQKFKSAKIQSRKSKLFSCLKCPYSANRKSDVTRHQMVHNETGSERSYNCPICSANYKHLPLLKKHVELHLDNASSAKESKRRKKSLQTNKV